MENNSLIKDIGRSYIVSSFIPAALFITIATLIFKDFAPSFLSRRIIANDQLYAGQWAILILLTTWIGFALYSGWHWTVELYEGYKLPKSISSYLSKRMKRLYLRKTRRIRRYKELLDQENETLEEKAERKKLEPLALGDYAVVEIDFPINGNILPTRLGNILRSSERYAFDHYKMDSLGVFPRLVHLFPIDFKNNLEESNNKLIFLLNSSFLSTALGVSAILLVVLRIPCYLLNPKIFELGIFNAIAGFTCTLSSSPTNFFQQGFSHLNEWKYTFIGIVFILLGYGLYELTITSAREFAKMIRSGFDLYRYDLFKALSIPMPNNFKDEKMKWYNLSNFLIAGEDGLSPVVPDIAFPTKESAQPVQPDRPIQSTTSEKQDQPTESVQPEQPTFTSLGLGVRGEITVLEEKKKSKKQKRSRSVSVYQLKFF